MRGRLKGDDWGDYVGDEEGVSYGRLRQTKGEYGTPCALAETELAVTVPGHYPFGPLFGRSDIAPSSHFPFGRRAGLSRPGISGNSA